MKTMLELKILFVVFIVLSCLTFVQAEEITITTYYPSPYGSYNDLTVNRNLRARGTTPADAAIFATNTAPTAVILDKYAILAKTYDAVNNVQGALARVWSPGGQIWQMAVYGFAPAGGAAVRQYAGYFAGDIFISGSINTCTRFTFTANSGIQGCPVGTSLPMSPLQPVNSNGFFLCCKYQ